MRAAVDQFMFFNMLISIMNVVISCMLLVSLTNLIIYYVIHSIHILFNMSLTCIGFVVRICSDNMILSHVVILKCSINVV